ncbi:MAG TPA: hypothetical protein VEJ46_01080 [Candidatus Acidoferrum sp.]|nr:hypothetical protein [Candidatus Acidoferrum sp.]
MARKRNASSNIQRRFVFKIVTLMLWPLLAASAAVPWQSEGSGTPPAASSPAGQSSETPAHPVLPRGKKLMLKDGSFQLVREYQVEGDRVRYYSLDSSSWEAMPASLVDWDATKKVEAEEGLRDATLATKVRTQEENRVIPPLDIDASLEVAPGVFLPPGDNLFVFDGKSVLPLPQAETRSKLSKGRLLEQVMVPIPIVPSRQNVSVQGARAKFRLRNRQPEFYIRTADAREPRLELIRAKPHGDSRLIEHLDELFGEHAELRDSLPMQKWPVARGVYRFTISQPLAPGEYALAEALEEEGMSLYVWDFGVDPAGAPAKPEPK